jgi:hypothetical protein
MRSTPRRLGALLLLTAALDGCRPTPDVAATEPDVVTSTLGMRTRGYEVWLIDQSNNTGTTFGGKIAIYDGPALAASPQLATPASTIDLGAATSALCMARTGANPVRPHMLFFNEKHDRAVLAFVASGHVVVFDAERRTPLACVRTSAGAAGARQAHAAIPSPDNSYILIANQNGKLLERIDVDYRKDVYTLNTAATLNLATCTTPSGKACEDPTLRPDNAPICPIVDATSSRSWVTLRGGGLLVVDPRRTPMRIIAEYSRDVIHGNGCGGVQHGPFMFVTSGGGTANNLTEFDVYRFVAPAFFGSFERPAEMPKPKVVFSDDHTEHRDSHGVAEIGGFIWVTDRAKNVVEIFRATSRKHVGTMNLVSAHSSDPTPDLLDVSPDSRFIFVALRGPIPLSGDPHVATGSTPGVAVLEVKDGGARGTVRGIARMTNLDGTVERADAHAVRVRRK